MITCFCKKVKQFDINSLENIDNYSSQAQYIQSFMPTLKHLHNCSCPKCKRIDGFCFHCTYERNISFVLNSEVVNFKVTVTRVICTSCGSTHALLPDFIVPYKIFSSPSICKIVGDAATSSVLEIAAKISVSYQLIYHFISLFFSFFSNVSILNNTNEYFHVFNESIYLEIFSLNNCNSSFRFEYFSFYRWVFLMSKFRNSKYNSIYIGLA